jgi:hypothetical protein
MMLQSRDESGAGIGPTTPALRQVSSYWDAGHIDLQVSVPPVTWPVAAFTVAPLLTSQDWPGGPAKQPGGEASASAATLAG